MKEDKGMENENFRRPKAVALSYDSDAGDAPRVVAKGAGYLAERILELAEEHGVEIYRDADLVEVLSKLDVDREIPEAMYQAVAEVLAFVYRLNRSVS